MRCITQFGLILVTFLVQISLFEAVVAERSQRIKFVADQSDCTLDDVQKTKGKCTPFRSCPFAIENYKADLWPKRCSGAVVCCPIEETFAEKKCAEWRSYLHTRFTFGEPYEEPRCGENGQGFIVGGREAKKYEFPHAVSLGYKYPNESALFVCGGTLISEQYVLTAAHCINTVKGRPLVALVGDITIKRVTAPQTRKLVPIVDWILHEGYKPPITYNDIAVVKLAEKLDLTRYLLPACLPRPNRLRKLDTFEAVGWGTLGLGEPTSDTLMAVNLSLFNQNECDPYFADTSDRQFKYPQGIKRGQLCAGDKTNSGKDSCNGDSGGPLTMNEVYKGVTLRCFFTVEGITSFGSKLCGYGTPGVYTKVLGYVPWLERVVFGVS